MNMWLHGEPTAEIKRGQPGHGPQDLTKKYVALILRALGGAGFVRERVRRELGV
jgi:hypothetical protein